MTSVLVAEFLQLVLDSIACVLWIIRTPLSSGGCYPIHHTVTQTILKSLLPFRLSSSICYTRVLPRYAVERKQLGLLYFYYLAGLTDCWHRALK